MVRNLFGFLALFVLTSTASAQGLAEEERKEGFISLINGNDFGGWRFTGKDKATNKPYGSALGQVPANWKAGNGMIQLLQGGNTHLATQWDFDDFDVRLQWRALGKSYNSGFYVRSGSAVGANQINLNSKAVGELINTERSLKGKAPGVPELHKVGGSGEWNEWRVLAVGKKLTLWVNGTKAWEIDGFTPARGYLGLQAEGTIDFRNCRIKELGYQVFSEPGDFKGEAWQTVDDFMVVSGPTTTLKSYKQYTLRLEFRGNGELALGDSVLKLDHEAFRPHLHPEGQFNYLQVKVADGKARVWLNLQDLNTEIAALEGPITITPSKRLEVRHFRVRPQ